jgi:hypothetical protein
VRFLVAGLFLVVLVGCGAEPSATQEVEPTESRAGSDGVTVDLPAGWHAMSADDAPVVDPVARVAVSSGPMENRETGCQVADYGPVDDAVSLIILEWQPNDDFELPPRPAQFGSEKLPVTPESIECFTGSGGTVQFADHGRQFGAYVLLGPDAPAELADEARAVLETLRVEPSQP